MAGMVPGTWILKDTRDDEASINYSEHSASLQPIVANIEVKAPGSGRNDALVQLTVWVAAQFNCV